MLENRWGLALASVGVIVVVSAAVALTSAHAREHDAVAFEQTVYTQDGQQLWSTERDIVDPANLTRWELSAYSTQRLVLGDGGILDDTLGSHLEGHGPGENVTVPGVLRPFDYGETTINRTYGPFNLTGHADREALEAELATSLAVGDTFQILGFTNATVTEVSNQTVRYRFDLEDGEMRTITDTDIPARVVHEEDGERFTVEIPLAEGDTFSLQRRCSFRTLALSPGHYIVLDEGPRAIELGRIVGPVPNASAMPLLVTEPVTIEVEIQQVDRLEGIANRISTAFAALGPR